MENKAVESYVEVRKGLVEELINIGRKSNPGYVGILQDATAFGLYEACQDIDASVMAETVLREHLSQFGKRVLIKVEEHLASVGLLLGGPKFCDSRVGHICKEALLGRDPEDSDKDVVDKVFKALFELDINKTLATIRENMILRNLVLDLQMKVEGLDDEDFAVSFSLASSKLQAVTNDLLKQKNWTLETRKRFLADLSSLLLVTRESGEYYGCTALEAFKLEALQWIHDEEEVSLVDASES